MRRLWRAVRRSPRAVIPTEDRRRLHRRNRDRWGSYIERGALLFLLVMYLLSFHSLGQQNAKIDRTQRATTEFIASQQSQRRQSSAAYCEAINTNARAIRALIVQGAKASKSFERLYRAAGQPAYRERVRRAERVAAGFPDLGDCSKFVARITPPPKP